MHREIFELAIRQRFSAYLALVARASWELATGMTGWFGA